MIKIVLLIIIIYLIFQYNFTNKCNNKLDIYEIENPQKDKFDELINDKFPTIFTNVCENFFDLQKYTIYDIYKFKKKQRNKLERNLKSHFAYYNIPFKLKYIFNFSLDVANSSSSIKKSTGSRFLICQLIGSKKIVLFPPNSKSSLYINNQTGNSFLNYFTADHSKYSNFETVPHIEIILYPGQMLFIPFKWYWCYYNEENGASITLNSESIFTNFLKRN